MLSVVGHQAHDVHASARDVGVAVGEPSSLTVRAMSANDDPVFETSPASMDRGPVKGACILCTNRWRKARTIITSRRKNNLSFAVGKFQKRHKHGSLRFHKNAPLRRFWQVRINTEVAPPVIT